MIEFAAGLFAGLGATWARSRLRGRFARSRDEAGGVRGPGAHLLPDPALGWLLRASGAIGIWVTELNPEEEGPRAERMVDAERLSVAQIAAVDRRLEQARDQEQGGAEKMDGGTLVFRAAGGVAVGLLLPGGGDLPALATVERDLERLLDGVRHRPQVVALAQAQTHEASLESVGSVGLRLAYQLERSLNAEALVAARDANGVRVVGVSGRGDRRLLDVVLPAECELAMVATGAAPETRSVGDPLGAAVPDRRRRQGSAFLVPILVGRDAIGAVAVYLPGNEEPVGAAMAELREAVSNAGPRLSRALEGEVAKRVATTDPLTGLPNRRTVDEQLHRHGVQEGAMIHADLDNFKQLNDTLGHPAGDAALVHFARILREQVRGSDTPARVGGEEFAVWLPGASLELGMRIAERIRVKLATTPWDWKGRHWPLSASFGVAACPETNRSIENLPEQADAALYLAKNGGRNRVEAAGTTGGPTAGGGRGAGGRGGASGTGG